MTIKNKECDRLTGFCACGEYHGPGYGLPPRAKPPDGYVPALTSPEDPKYVQAQKDGKEPLEYVVYEVLALDARCHKHGADKYGVRNWRVDNIRASTYEGAMLRHFVAWAKGEDIDPDSGLPHLTHLRACCAVVLDSAAHGTLIDDRGRATRVEGEE